MNKWIFVGSLGTVFLVTLGFSYGPGYGGRLSAFLGSNVTNSPKMSPSDMVTPVVTSKREVTLKNVTNVTSVSPLVSPLMSPLIYGASQSSIVSPSVSPVTSRASTVSPTRTPAPIVSPSSTVIQQTPTLSPTSLSETSTPIITTETPSSTPIPTSSPQSTKININTAGLIELEDITGVGPKIAPRIIDYRIANGPFQTIEDIIKVKGIGDATFQKMKDQITVGP